MKKWRIAAFVLLFCAICVCAAPARAQEAFPTKPMPIIVPYAPEAAWGLDRPHLIGEIQRVFRSARAGAQQAGRHRGYRHGVRGFLEAGRIQHLCIRRPGHGVSAPDEREHPLHLQRSQRGRGVCQVSPSSWSARTFP